MCKANLAFNWSESAHVANFGRCLILTEKSLSWKAFFLYFSISACTRFEMKAVVRQNKVHTNISVITAIQVTVCRLMTG